MQQICWNGQSFEKILKHHVQRICLKRYIFGEVGNKEILYTRLYAFQNSLGVIFTVEQLLTKNYRLLFHITLFLVHFNNFEVIRS